ncbi:RNA-directed DNA polymerase [Cetobacterium sp.]
MIGFYSNKVKIDLNNSKLKNKICLPIGLYSSPIIANYILKPLDDIMVTTISPASYSRYVDDMFIVFKESREHLFKTKTEYLNKKIKPLLNKIKQLNLEINEHKTVVEWGSTNTKNSNIEALKKKLDEKM